MTHLASPSPTELYVKIAAVSVQTWAGPGSVPGVRRVKEKDRGKGKCPKCHHPRRLHGRLKTLEGTHRVCPLDKIITGVQGERWVCDPSIFGRTYALLGLPPTVQPGPSRCPRAGVGCEGTWGPNGCSRCYAG